MMTSKLKLMAISSLFLLALTGNVFATESYKECQNRVFDETDNCLDKEDSAENYGSCVGWLNSRGGIGQCSKLSINDSKGTKNLLNTNTTKTSSQVGKKGYK